MWLLRCWCYTSNMVDEYEVLYVGRKCWRVCVAKKAMHTK